MFGDYLQSPLPLNSSLNPIYFHFRVLWYHREKAEPSQLQEPEMLIHVMPNGIPWRFIYIDFQI